MVLDVGGYVLAGGRSSRMGRDKALLELAGRPLVAHAVARLRRVCGEVHILGDRPELAAYAPLVGDLHGGCGPLGGMEAALAHTSSKWSLFIPVDMPFLPTAFLTAWIEGVDRGIESAARIAMFTVNGQPQPTLCLLHQELASFVRRAVGRGEFKVYPVLKEAATALAVKYQTSFDKVFKETQWSDDQKIEEDVFGKLTERQRTWRHLWFANLNTPQEFAEAEKHLDVLDFED